MMKFLVTTLREAQDILSYFAEFHDAYIESMTLRSRYETLPEIQRLYPGFDVTIVFSHNSYANDNPYTRKVVAEFLDVSDYRFELRDIKSGTFFIINTLIQQVEDDNLALEIEFSECDGNGHMVNVKKRIMKFKRAVFAEV